MWEVIHVLNSVTHLHSGSEWDFSIIEGWKKFGKNKNFLNEIYRGRLLINVNLNCSIERQLRVNKAY